MFQVNSQIIKPEERSVLRRLVSIMSALELRFVQERAEDGQLTYRLDPYVLLCSFSFVISTTCSAVDVFITYDGKRAPDISLSRYAVRHLVAQEVRRRVGILKASVYGLDRSRLKLPLGSISLRREREGSTQTCSEGEYSLQSSGSPFLLERSGQRRFRRRV